MIRFWADHIATDTNVEQRIEIHDNGFNGTAQKMKGTGSDWMSFSHSKIDPQDPFGNPLQKGNLKVKLWIRNQQERDLLDNILAASDQRFKMRYVVDGNDEWEGFLLPDLSSYSEDNPSQATFTEKILVSLRGLIMILLVQLP